MNSSWRRSDRGPIWCQGGCRWKCNFNVGRKTDSQRFTVYRAISARVAGAAITRWPSLVCRWSGGKIQLIADRLREVSLRDVICGEVWRYTQREWASRATITSLYTVVVRSGVTKSEAPWGKHFGRPPPPQGMSVFRKMTGWIVALLRHGQDRVWQAFC